MQGVGPPLVTPFTRDGAIDEPALRDLVTWVEDRGVDFIVPCGSNGEAELMTAEERSRVVEIVAEEASVPVIAGTGNPGLRETVDATETAAEVGADGALVVTPFYYNHDQETLVEYYRELADAVSIPVYLYSMPAFADVRIEPETVERLASHPNIAGMKDSAADIAELIRTVRLTEDESFDPMIGSGSVLAQALDVGATGGVVALANIAPLATSEIFETHADDPAAARNRNAEFVALNRAITTVHGVAGLKWAMRERGAPAGYPRSPHRPINDEQKEHLASLIADL